MDSNVKFKSIIEITPCTNTENYIEYMDSSFSSVSDKATFANKIGIDLYLQIQKIIQNKIPYYHSSSRKCN